MANSLDALHTQDMISSSNQIARSEPKFNQSWFHQLQLRNVVHLTNLLLPAAAAVDIHLSINCAQVLIEMLWLTHFGPFQVELSLSQFLRIQWGWAKPNPFYRTHFVSLKYLAFPSFAPMFRVCHLDYLGYALENHVQTDFDWLCQLMNIKS